MSGKHVNPVRRRCARNYNIIFESVIRQSFSARVIDDSARTPAASRGRDGGEIGTGPRLAGGNRSRGYLLMMGSLIINCRTPSRTNSVKPPRQTRAHGVDEARCVSAVINWGWQGINNRNNTWFRRSVLRDAVPELGPYRRFRLIRRGPRGDRRQTATGTPESAWTRVVAGPRKRVGRKIRREFDGVKARRRSRRESAERTKKQNHKATTGRVRNRTGKNPGSTRFYVIRL